MRLYVVAGEDWYRFFRLRWSARRFFARQFGTVLLSRVTRNGGLEVLAERLKEENDG